MPADPTAGAIRAPPAEDLSHWRCPCWCSPHHTPPLAPAAATRPGTEAEKVYAYAPGQVYKVTVALDAPLDVILEAGEKVQTVLDSDPKPIVQGQPVPENGTPKPEVKARWEYREAVDGVGEQARPHLLIRALEADATAGVTLTTTKRVYYLTCKSVKTSPIRGVRWTYAADPAGASRPEDKAPAPAAPSGRAAPLPRRLPAQSVGAAPHLDAARRAR